MVVSKDRSFGTYTEEEWLAWRRRGVGGSDAPVIMGLSPYKGWLALYVDKTDRGLDPREPNESAYWGQQLEEIVAREFEKRSGLRVAEPTTPLVQHQTLTWMIGTPDRYVYDPVTGAFLGILECKTTAARRDEEWEQGPASYAVCQLQHYLAVVNAPRGWIAVLIGGQRYAHFAVERDDAYIERLVAEEARFWEHVTTDTPPPPDGRESTSSIINTKFQTSILDSSVELEGEARDAALRLIELAKEVPVVEIDRLKNVVKLALREHEVGLVDGVPLISWRPSSRTTFDVKRFKAERPDLVDAYTRVSEHRSFRTHNRRHAGDASFEEDE